MDLPPLRPVEELALLPADRLQLLRDVAADSFRTLDEMLPMLKRHAWIQRAVTLVNFSIGAWCLTRPASQWLVELLYITGTLNFIVGARSLIKIEKPLHDTQAMIYHAVSLIGRIDKALEAQKGERNESRNDTA